MESAPNQAGQESSLGSRPTLYEFVQAVVRDFAPEEMMLLAGLGQLDEVEIGSRFKRGSRRDDPLGFGMGEAVALVTPVVWTVVQEIATRIGDTTADGLSSRVRALMRKKRRPGTPAAPLPHFGRAECDEVRRKVLELAMQGGMKKERAELLAYKVAAQLETADDGPRPGDA